MLTRRQHAIWVTRENSPNKSLAVDTNTHFGVCLSSKTVWSGWDCEWKPFWLISAHPWWGLKRRSVFRCCCWPWTTSSHSQLCCCRVDADICGNTWVSASPGRRFIRQSKWRARYAAQRFCFHGNGVKQPIRRLQCVLFEMAVRKKIRWRFNWQRVCMKEPCMSAVILLCNAWRVNIRKV